MDTPLRNYITVDDITNKLFNRSDVTVRENYVQRANLELEDLAKRLGVSPIGISANTHITVYEYLTQYAVAKYCLDYTGFNNTDGYQDTPDVYETTYAKMAYQMQHSKGLITIATLTGAEETPRNRAVVSGRIFYG